MNILQKVGNFKKEINLKKVNYSQINLLLIVVFLVSPNIYCMISFHDKLLSEFVLEGGGKYIEKFKKDKNDYSDIDYGDVIKDKSIFSCDFDERNGIGVGLVALRENGLQQAFMTHYKPEKTSEHIETINFFCKKFNKGVDKNPIVRAVLIIMQPSKGEWNIEENKLIKTPKYFDKVESLIDKVKKSLKLKNIKDITVKPKEVYYYSGFYSDADQEEPMCEINGKEVPKEFEIVLSDESYYHSKASEHEEKLVYKN